MNLRFYIIASILFIICVPTLYAQQNLKRSETNNDSISLLIIDKVNLYDRKIDTLKLKCFSPKKRIPKYEGLSPELFAYFSPFIFHESDISDSFSLNAKSASDKFDRANLFNLYINHFDVVSATAKRLLDENKIKTSYEEPASQQVDMAETMSPAPIEPDIIVYSPVVSKPNFWKYSGEFYLQFLQNYISGNWYKGGESNYSALGSITFEANYNNKQKVKWDNKLELKIGFITSKSDSLHSFKTSEDLIRYTSKLGLQASKKWYYTLQMVANTQFYKGYKSNDATVYSDFISPLNVNVSLGMDYSVEALNKRLTGNIHLAPIAYNFRYVRLLPLAVRYGLKEGRHVLHDIGSQFTAELTWKFSDNVMWKSRLYGFTTFKKAELEWENTFSLKFNRFISSNIFIYPRFDDGISRDEHHGYWQLKEFVSVGLNYSF
ncbi:MAG: DUF3078 domain-containing protein [Prevotella sp.]|nr:DUF3078 domain-containing protein [Prevotella sp.]